MGKNKRKPSNIRKQPNFQFDDRGESFKRSKRFNSGYEESAGNPRDAETIYRVLCPARKIGGVIAKGGDIIKSLRDETGAKIKVGETIPGTDERVVIIFSSSTKKPRTYNNNNNPEDEEQPTNPENDDPREKEQESMPPHCSAQDALLKVHQKIAEEEDLYGGILQDQSTEDAIVTARLLVPNNQVGCLLGKGGHVIKKLRDDTGANIRILAADHLPACAMTTDELVQAPWDPKSPTIEAILQIQFRTNSKEGVITARLLVPSSKVGCLLGQGGHIINEMRKRTQADDGKPNFTPPDEELVQIHGNIDVARYALTEIASRLRMRSLEVISAAVEPGPMGPFQRFGPPESFLPRILPPPGMIGAGSSSGYEHAKISGAHVKLNNPQSGSSECIVDVHGSSEQMHAAQNLLQSLIISAVQSYNTGQPQVPHSSAGRNFNAHRQPTPYASAMQNSNPQQQRPYTSVPNVNAQHQQSPYLSAQNFNIQQQRSPHAPSVQNYHNHKQSPYASALQNLDQQQQQNSYASAAQNFDSQQQQNAYTFTQNFDSQQQLNAYASAALNFDSQQQTSHASAAQNFNTHQQYQQPTPLLPCKVPTHCSSKVRMLLLYRTMICSNPKARFSTNFLVWHFCNIML